jgi:hypothetical protein
VAGRIISSRGGELLSGVVEPGAAAIAMAVTELEVQRGETLDFVVEPRSSPDFDSFEWPLVIQGPQGQWSAKEGFGGPPPKRGKPLTPWEKYAQALLTTNEFVFVD